MGFWKQGKLHLEFTVYLILSSSLFLQPTYADFAIHIMVDNVNQTRCFPNLFDKFPKLVKLRDDVADLPAIKKWIQERPNCTYYNIK